MHIGIPLFPSVDDLKWVVGLLLSLSLSLSLSLIFWIGNLRKFSIPSENYKKTVSPGRAAQSLISFGARPLKGSNSCS